jgi:hypothetical protein
VWFVAVLGAQTPGAAELLLDGAAPSAPVARLPGAALRLAVRGAPGAAVVLFSGPDLLPPQPLFGGSLAVVPQAIHLNAFDPLHPRFGESRLTTTGEALFEMRFAPSALGAALSFQAAVEDLGSPFGFSLTPVRRVLAVAPPPPPPPPAATPRIVRGPYLEQTGSISTLVSVRLDQAGPLSVEIGPDGVVWNAVFAAAAPALDHTVLVNGLAAGTAYRYRLLSGATILAEGPGLSFKTAPPPGSTAPFRFLAWGDCGTGNSAQIRLSERMEELRPRPDFMLVLGDIIYPNGEAALYDQNFFLPYAGLLASMPVWPAYGNHDAATLGGAGYFDAFHLPTTSPGGERYYSFDWGDAHFVCLDTQTSLAASNPMFPWLVADLASTTKTWRIVFFHHPPYSGGTHPDQLSVQATIVPLLDQAGVDLVLCGHSHVMERSFLLAGHAIVQSDPHDYDKSAAPTSAGAVYAVAGSGGQIGDLLFNPNHPLMAFQLGGKLGDLVVEIEGPNLRGYFLDDAGNPHDRFSITKGPDAIAPFPAAVRSGVAARSATVVFDEPVQAGAGPGGAEDPSRYVLDGVVPAVAATLGPDRRTVDVRFPVVPTGVAHTVAVGAVADLATPPNLSTPTALDYVDEPWRRAVLPGSSWHLYAAVAPPPTNFAERDFDDSTWPHAATPIGYGGGLFPVGAPGTALPGMAGNYAAFYARADFFVDDPAEIESVRFEARFDDGFVAYLNGVEIARRGVPLG